jgi:hypothetical protein
MYPSVFSHGTVLTFSYMLKGLSRLRHLQSDDLTFRLNLIHCLPRSHYTARLDLIINNKLTPNPDHFLAHKTARLSFPKETRVQICTHKNLWIQNTVHRSITLFHLIERRHLAVQLLIPEEIVGEVELSSIDGCQHHLGLVRLDLLCQPKVAYLKKGNTCV